MARSKHYSDLFKKGMDGDNEDVQLEDTDSDDEKVRKHLAEHEPSLYLDSLEVQTIEEQ